MTVQLIPFIMLDGTAKEAIRFYELALGAKILFTQTYGEGPEQPGHPLPPEARDRLAHSVLKVGDMELFVADTLPGQAHRPGNQMHICLTTDEKEKAEQFYAALRQGGEVNIPLGEIHFSPAYGMVTDKFGVVFQIFTRRPR